LFLFGNNSDRQLGCSIPDQYIGPLEVSLPDPIKAVACGNQHTVVLTEKGEVYTCGMIYNFFNWDKHFLIINRKRRSWTTWSWSQSFNCKTF
jgi:alpha-tubulin suppressor-like RCC1 family protein